jgi:hypothetical protein
MLFPTAFVFVASEYRVRSQQTISPFVKQMIATVTRDFVQQMTPTLHASES